MKFKFYLVLFILVFFLIIIFFKIFFIKNIIYYDMDINLTSSSEIGFNLDSDKLHFGDVPINSPYAYRNIEFQNVYDYPVSIKLISMGEMSDSISYEYNGTQYSNLIFSLAPGQVNNIKVIYSDSSNEEGFLKGKLILIFLRNLDSFL